MATQQRSRADTATNGTPLVERALAVVSPSWAAARGEARLRAARAWHTEQQLRNYDGAAISRRTQGWVSPTGSGSAMVSTALDRLRARSRELARNNEWMSKGLAVIEDDVVGTGFAVKFTHKDQAVADRAAAKWAEWADTLQIDADGLADFSGLLSLAVRGMAEGGDVVLRRRWRKADDGLAVPLQIQLLEGDHIDAQRDGIDTGGNRTVQGVAHNLLGQRSGYWLFREHPGDNWRATSESVLVPAAEVLHLFREDRKGQVRGVPWGAPCLLRLRDLAEWEDATLLHAKLANMYVGVVRMPNQVAPFNALGDDGKPMEQVEEWKPGQVQYLNPGEELTFTEPPPPAATHSDYLRVGLLAVAAGLQIPYEALTGDLRNTSFSSGRLGWLQWQRRIEAYRWRILVPRVCQPIARWFLEALAVTDPRFREVVTEWNPPHREMIDPTQEVAAFERAIRAGLTTRREVVRSLGRDPAEVLRETAADNQAAREAGVMWSTDPGNDLGRKPAGEPGRKPGQAANN